MGLVPKTSISVDGKEYVIALDMWALSKYKEQTKRDLLKGESPEGTDELLAFFWAALLREQPDITLEDVGHLLHLGNIEEVTEKLTSLYNVSMPEGEGEEKNAGGSIG